ncbi:hypothetical protein GGI05_004089, partial [Coemansia sp. RSA 2603]
TTVARRRLHTIASNLHLRRRTSERRTSTDEPPSVVELENGTFLQLSSNIHHAAAHRVHTIVMSLTERIQQFEIQLALESIGFKKTQWDQARTL